ncbi:MAG: OmpA family protein [Polyangiaceae bacterium]|jgi:outer membrane protein OmpA-like peptidoglycan-associated protein
MTTLRSTGVLLAIATTAGCAASIPPQDLVTARAAYARANHGVAATFDPADVHAAGESLDAAEQSFAKNGASPQTVDLAYVAGRRAEIAEARGIAMQSAAEQQAIVGNMHDAQTAQVAATSAQLGRANVQIALQGQALQNQDQQLQTERERRADADQRAAKAASDLAAFASVKQEARGMVITLSGSVLFASNRSDLLPSAQAKLNDVAKALTKQDAESKITVEGHTDSQGDASYNQELSQRRAQTVRDYLVSQGMAADRVTSEGFGLTRPIADNSSPEGRANNRRVEIVVQPPRPAI